MSGFFRNLIRGLSQPVVNLAQAIYNAGVNIYNAISSVPPVEVAPVAEPVEDDPELVGVIEGVENIGPAVFITRTLPLDIELALPYQILDPSRELLEEYMTDDFRGSIRITYEYEGRDFVESVRFQTDIAAIMEDLSNLVDNLINKYEGVIVKEIKLRLLRVDPNEGVMGSAYAESCISLPETGLVLRDSPDYIIYNPSSKTNCMFQCVVVSMDPRVLGRGHLVTKGGERLYQRDPIVTRASRLKSLSGCTNAISTYEDLEKVSKYCGIFITVMDIQKRPIYHCGDSSLAIHIEMIWHRQHSYAYIPYREEIEHRKREPSKTVRISKPENNRDMNFYAADLEAFRNSEDCSVAYSIAYAYYNLGETVYRSFIGHEDCIDRFFESLFEDKKNKTIYFHNGGKYDINVIIQNYLLNQDKYGIDNKAKVYLNGRYARFVVYSGKTKLTFLDSICLFGLSLDKCTGSKGFDVQHKKLTGSIDHNLVNIDNYRVIMSEGQHGVSGEEYLKNDVIGLLECLDKFGSSIWEDCGINITKVISASSISKRIFKQNFLKTETPVYLLSEDEDKFIRLTYHGGRTESFFKGYYGDEDIEDIVCRKGKLYYYDFTSLYPSVAATGACGIPYGRCHPLNVRSGFFKEGELINTDRQISFMKTNALFLRCYVKTLNKTVKPLHCVQVDKTGRLVFPIFNDWTEIYLTGEEILVGIETGYYAYKPISGYWFKKAPILKDYFQHLFSKKQEATLAGLEAKALCYKIIANSGYGFWALKTENRTDVDILDIDDYDSFLHRVIDGFDDMYECGKKLIISYRKSIAACEKNIAIGSYITSLARIKIWSLINDIELKGGTVIYCDTDSVITDYKLESDEDLMTKYCPDGTGEMLGSLKNEVKDSVKKYCKSKRIELNPKDCFDRAFFAGLKCYSYSAFFNHKDSEGGDVVAEITDSKLKGYKQYGEFTKSTDNVRRLDREDYIKLLRGDKLTQRVAQFSSNKKGKYQTWQKIQEIEKKFEFVYNKGKLDKVTGIIYPFVLPDDNDLIGETVIEEHAD